MRNQFKDNKLSHSKIHKNHPAKMWNSKFFLLNEGLHGLFGGLFHRFRVKRRLSKRKLTF